MGHEAKQRTGHEIAREQLRRLCRLTDCVYAVALVLVIQWLPLPEESANAGEGGVWLLDLFGEFLANELAAVVGLVFVIVYWLRSNVLLGYLERTDGRHTSFSIASVFFLLFLMYIVRVGGGLTPASGRVGESLAIFLTGVMAAAAWWHARRSGLVREGLTPDQMLRVQREAYAEPITALLTLPLAYVGAVSWNLAWLLYIPIVAVLKRRAAKRP